MDLFLVYRLAFVNLRRATSYASNMLYHSKGLHVTRVTGGMGAAPIGNQQATN